MYIDNDDFSVWMQKLYAKLEELCKDVRVLRNADKVLPEDDTYWIIKTCVYYSK